MLSINKLDNSSSYLLMKIFNANEVQTKAPKIAIDISKWILSITIRFC